MVVGNRKSREREGTGERYFKEGRELRGAIVQIVLHRAPAKSYLQNERNVNGRDDLRLGEKQNDE